jgi:hypothetical protein
VEQHIGPKSPPVHGAATDPAFVPGLMSVRPAEREDGATEPVADEAVEEVDEQLPGEPPEKPEAAAPGPETSPTVPDGPPDGENSDAGVTDTEATGTGGPGTEFEAADRRGAIIANRTGLVLRLDDQEAEFDWSEIGAVEYGTAKYGRRLTVTVHLRDRHKYESDVTAGSKARLQEWTEELDAVLDAYFEE